MFFTDSAFSCPDYEAIQAFGRVVPTLTVIEVRKPARSFAIHDVVAKSSFWLRMSSVVQYYCFHMSHQQSFLPESHSSLLISPYIYRHDIKSFPYILLSLLRLRPQLQ